MPDMKTRPLSVLDLAPISTGEAASDVLRRTTDLARVAERLGFERYWFAEHHSMPSIASSSPEVLIAHIAASTERIRVGSGGIMLPNHVPLKVAEVFHTLEALHPGRIDLGIGRAPGTDPLTLRALRSFDAQQFPAQLAELRSFSRGDFPEDHPFRPIRVMPDDVNLPPIWLLGSSGASARLAGTLGLGYGFARHFSQTSPVPAMHAYRESFEPSAQFPEPHAILAVGVICAETDAEAQYLAASMDLMWVRLRNGTPGPIPSPDESLAYPYSDIERSTAAGYRGLQIVGTPDHVCAEIERLAEESLADEVMVTTMVYDHEARLRSYRLLAEAMIAQRRPDSPGED